MLGLAIYLCNQHIYSPSRRRGDRAELVRVTSERPLRCVVFDERRSSSRPEATAWLESMKKGFALRTRSQLDVPTTGLDSQPWNDHITFLDFEPLPFQRVAGAANRIATEPVAR